MPEEKFIHANGLQFHLIDWGGRGDWLVLLHGLASQAHIWDLVAPRLTDSFHIIALNQRGHGLTDKPDSGYDFTTLTHDLTQVLDALKIERAAFGGHSWGGNVALQYAAVQPARVNSLALVDGGFLEFGDQTDWPSAEKMLEPPDLIGTPLKEFRASLKFWLGPAWSPQTEAIVLHNFEVRADATLAPWLKKVNHMQVVRALYDHRPSQLYAQLQCPVLLIPAVPPEPHDERTQGVLTNKRHNIALAEERLARSRTIWLENTIHDIPLQRPAELAEAIRIFNRAS